MLGTICIFTSLIGFTHNKHRKNIFEHNKDVQYAHFCIVLQLPIYEYKLRLKMLNNFFLDGDQEID